MATGKETPRQRMIGMMYLVLTALLALQVSSAVIEKFYALNKSIEKNVANSAQYNADKVQTIQAAVKERGNRKNEMQVAQQAKELNIKSQELRAFMETLKTEMIEKTGGYDEDGSLKGAKEETDVEVYMLGTNKSNGKAYELQNRLNEYVAFINKRSGTSMPPIALDAKDDVLFQKNSDQRNKDFAQLNFSQTPLVAAMAVISDLETKVTTMESSLMNSYAAKVGEGDYKVNSLKPIVRAKSKYVPAGTKYEAEVMMAATSTSQLPTMNVGNQALKVDGSGIGSYDFLAGGGAYSADGLLKKIWTAQIKMRQPNGQDTVYSVSEEYYVVKPVIQMQSAAMKALYFNCGNKVDILVPALGAQYNPEFKSTGATIKPGGTKSRVYIIPNAPTAKIAVYNNGQFIGEENFKVIPIPKPTVEVRVNGKLINSKVGVTSSGLKSISIKAIPTPEFAASQPDDCTYKVVEWEVYFGRGRRAASGLSPQNPPQEYINMGSIANSLQDKDMIFVTAKKVMRKTYLGTWEEVKVSSTPIMIPVYN
ncbi:gliding motility protein GldM [uncultured Cytophaga sp.]|uniref:type IX secretion system motor protein PorM/GldM n=1 Tax=uncultured Cytophaga sp. TaxID=160238 RepID=UPI002601A7C5|nr:gliding motility protein GldM [uncultured Cytophaga sp.]